MIIKSFELEKLKSIKYKLHLIYGNNEGIKEDIINNTYLKDFSGEIIKYDEQEIISNKDNFFSNLLTNSLFKVNKLIIISRGSDKLTNILIEVLEKDIIDVKIIIKCSNLEKKSKLRNLFEKNKQLYCVPFYEDDVKTLSSLALSYLNKNKIKVSNETVNLLVKV